MREIKAYIRDIDAFSRPIGDWYGMEGLGFIYIHDNTDPYVINWRTGHVLDAYTVEDTLWDMFREENPDLDEDEADGRFGDYVRSSRDTVLDMFEDAWNNGIDGFMRAEYRDVHPVLGETVYIGRPRR